MANITVTEAAEFIPTIVAVEALLALRGNIVMPFLINRNFDMGRGGFSVGDTINVPVNGSIVTNSKAANTDVIRQTPTATKKSLVLEKHEEATFLIESIVRALEVGDQIVGYAKDAGTAHAEAVETYIATKFAGFSAETGSANTPADAADIRRLRKLLFDAKVPKADMSKLNIILSSGDAEALLAIDAFTSAEKIGRTGEIQTGALRNYYGMNIWESQFIPTDGGSPEANINLAFHENALMFATRMLEEIPDGFGARSQIVQEESIGFRQIFSYDKDALGMQFTMDALYGCAELRSAFGIKFLT